QAILDFVPERGCLETCRNGLRHLRPSPAQEPRCKCHVVLDRHWKRARTLEDHPDPLPQLEQTIRGEYVFLAEEHLSLGSRTRNKVVHAVEDAKQRALAAAGR